MEINNNSFHNRNYGVKLFYDQIDTAQADMSFSNFTVTHSAFEMNNVNYIRDLFESMFDYRKIVLLMFSIKNDKNSIKEFVFSKKIPIHLSLEFKKTLIEEYEQNLESIINEEESLIKLIPNK